MALLVIWLVAPFGSLQPVAGTTWLSTNDLWDSAYVEQIQIDQMTKQIRVIEDSNAENAAIEIFCRFS